MSIARHHAEWLSLLESSGPFLSLPVLLRAFPQGLDAIDPELARNVRLAYEEWADTVGSLRPDPAIHTAWIRFVLREVLELDEQTLLEGPAIPEMIKATLLEHGEVLRPDLIVQRVGRAEPSRMLIQIVPAGQDLNRPLAGRHWKASPATRMMELLHAAGVRLGLVTDGEQWMLVHAPRGETTGFATWYANLWIEERITLQSFRSLLHASRFFGVDEKGMIEALIAESAANQQDVTDQLGYQVRAAVEVLVQSLDRIDKDRNRALLAGIDERQLYEAALTVMMRLVFLFSAEERGLLRLGDALYDQHYAVSTLRAQLRAVADQHGEEVLERRHDAWSRLLAIFRVVYGGVQHEALRLPAYGGQLFDPDRFPFLEGRAVGTSWRTDIAQPVPIDNRTVLHLLEALQILQVKVPGGGAEPRRLSFRALDIEQIGHVYEGLLDHTAVRAREPVLGVQGSKDREPEVPLAALEALAANGEAALVAFLQEQTGRSPKALATALKPDLLIDINKLLIACDNDPALVERVRPFGGLLRLDSFGYPVVIAQGSVYVTAGTDRRTSGTHYTPRSLTEPIVQHTLDPLVYVGPAEGLPQEQWRLRSAAEILRLTVCDMAMGSGAFLVQACRYLSERLVEAWETIEAASPGRVVITPEGALSTGASDEQPLPRDAEERLAIARRIVADRCLYGVDKNPLAVEMAKLSLWLVTLQKDRPFTFLDHALRCGDSLLGVDLDQLTMWSLTRGQPVQRSWFTRQLEEALDTALHLRRRIAATTVRDVRDAERKARLLHEAEEAMSLVRLGADLLVSSTLASEKVRDDVRADVLHRFSLAADSFRQHREGRFTAQGAQPGQEALADLRREADNLLGQHRPFHWPLEFPEVFVEGHADAPNTQGVLEPFAALREPLLAGLQESAPEPCTPGFAAIVGNPPFQGGSMITGSLGTPYRDYLVEYVGSGKRGLADLCTFFFLRGHNLVKAGGHVGLIATNTIAQGDTRAVGLDQITARNFVITRAVPSRKWPGVASLEVAHVWLWKGDWSGSYVLDNQIVDGITSFLTVPGRVNGIPFRLVANEDKSFKGSDILGMGFVLDETEAQEILAKGSRYREVVMPFLNGEDLNTNYNQAPSRWIINFYDWPIERAQSYPECWRIIEERVRPERQRKKSDGTYILRNPLPHRYWQYNDKRPALYSTIASMNKVLVTAIVTKNLAFSFLETGVVISKNVIVFPFDQPCYLALLQSSCHEAWARKYSSTLETRLNYSPTDAFENFPFPASLVGLDIIGETYHEHRRQIMLSRQEGLTKTYNRFHNPTESAEDIAELRRLHLEMDQAVAGAYGWADLDLGHGFHETKQGVRFTMSEAARREVLDRLLLLNHQRYAEEVKAGLHDKGAKKGKGKQGKKVSEGQGELF
ncbi:MAG TPA: type IIL restriction-modification enzyme MmeI [Herpetosiphonaceae bacterium]